MNNKGIKIKTPVLHHSYNGLTLTDSFKTFILVGFVLVSGGTVLYIYSRVITYSRLPLLTGPGEITPPISAMFAGILLETIFLVSQ